MLMANWCAGEAGESTPPIQSAWTGGTMEAFKTRLPSNQNSLEAREETRSPASLPCSAFISGEAGGGGDSEDGVLCCDRSHYRSDVCYLGGDARTDPSTSSVFLYNAPRGAVPEKVRPYTRKFEESIMRTITR